MTQIDGFKRSVYIKFSKEDGIYDLQRATGGRVDFQHDSGEISNVVIETAVMGAQKS